MPPWACTTPPTASASARLWLRHHPPWRCISRLFDEEFWNYAKLISGVLRYGMPIDKVVQLVDGLHLDSETINTWKNGVERALKQYIKDGTRGKGRCPQCGQENMAYQNGCLTCMACGYSKCN